MFHYLTLSVHSPSELTLVNSLADPVAWGRCLGLCVRSSVRTISGLHLSALYTKAFKLFGKETLLFFNAGLSLKADSLY